MRLFVACAPGLEPLLADEVRALELGVAREVPGGVELEGDLGVLWRANLELGLASHVLLRVGTLGAKHLGELAKKAARVDWATWLSPGTPVRVHATSRASKLYHTGAIAQRVGRALREQAGAELTEKGGADAPAPPLVVHARLERDVCTLSIDTSGEPLHRRGYRLATAKAPLREDLARALLIASGWDRASPLVDPMMGAGTIVIEAALLARRLPPGHLRPRFGFMGLRSHDEAAFERFRTQAVARALPRLDFPIHGRDRDAGAVAAARDNAERAGVRADLDLRRAPLGPRLWPFDDPPPDRGAVVANPPHGRRVGDRKTLGTLHQRLGRLVADLPPGWAFALLSSNRRLALRTGLALRTALVTDQGGTKVRMLVRASAPPPRQPEN
ncbi:MAG: THUMP domain-containing class I SAM-dependent RNA methyltransferase [Myxococcota bacterium]